MSIFLTRGSNFDQNFFKILNDFFLPSRPQLGVVRARLLAAREALRRGAEEHTGGHDPGGAHAGLQ